MDLPHHPDNLILVKPNKGVDGKFLFYALANAFNEGLFASQSAGACFPSLRINVSKKTRILAGTPNRLPIKAVAYVARYIPGTEDPGDTLLLRVGKNMGKPIFVE